MTRAGRGRLASVDGQLWLTFDWPKPTDRVPAACSACPWRGRRTRRVIAARPCPRCGGPVGRRITRAAR